MSKEVVIGVYDGLAKAQAAELHLGDVHLPVGQISLLSADVEAGQVYGNITEREVARAMAETGIQLTREQIAEYEQALEAGKLLLIFRGDNGLATKAYHALRHTDNEELTILNG